MKRGKVFWALGASLALLVAVLWVLPALAASVTPTIADNPKCSNGLVGFKPMDTMTGTYVYDVFAMGTLTMTIKDGPIVDWSSNFGISEVIVKGGPVGNVYSYDPASMGDTDLTTPTNPNNNKPYGLSHVEFCYESSQAVYADYGDLPVEYGITQFGEDGARHIPLSQGDVWLGVLRDLEMNIVPGADALDDDMDNDADEDGVLRGATWGEGSGSVTVTVTGPSCLMGWVDWATVDDMNTFVDFGFDYKFSENFLVDGITFTEKVIDNIYLPAAGEHLLTFALPSGFSNANVYARFRLSPATFLVPAGTANEVDEYVQCDQLAAELGGPVMGGEVEDYLWRFGPTAVDLKQVQAAPQQSATGVGILVVGVLASLTAVWVGRRRSK